MVSALACLTQALMVTWQPNSFASSLGLRPAWTNSTICWRNSGHKPLLDHYLPLCRIIKCPAYRGNSSQTHRWNPLRYVSQCEQERVGDLRTIAQMLYPTGDGSGNQAFFIDHARNAGLALSLYLFESYALRGGNTPYPTLGQLHRTSTGESRNLKAYLQRLAAEPYLSDACQTAFAGFLSQADDTFASIMGTFNAPLTAWADPLLDTATSADDFDLREVRKKPMSIYVCISPNKLSQAALVLNLFFSQLINENTKALPTQDPSLKRQCLLVMDEFTSIGAVDIIAHSVAYMAGYNLRLLPIIQSMAQLDTTYGKERARTIITNHANADCVCPMSSKMPMNTPTCWVTPP